MAPATPPATRGAAPASVRARAFAVSARGGVAIIVLDPGRREAAAAGQKIDQAGRRADSVISTGRPRCLPSFRLAARSSRVAYQSVVVTRSRPAAATAAA
jgi:hypothetical protein